jgi:hypothetical protein
MNASPTVERERKMPKTTTATAARITIMGDTLVIDHLSLQDAELAAFVAERTDTERAPLVERALRIGLLSVRDAGVTVNVDYIQKEFERLLHHTDASHEKAAHVLETSLRETFADGDGRLPVILERFLGNKGSLQRFVNDLFDEERRDSAIGRMRTLLDGYFDGDGALLTRMLDPRRTDSPLHGFRAEVRDALKDVGDRLLKLEAGREARAQERAKGSAKGIDFEDDVEASLGTIARGCGDIVEPTGRIVGDTVRGRKGDFVQTLNPAWTRGLTVRIAIEAKSGRKHLPDIRRELDMARINRGAAVALAVFAAGCAPTGCAPLTLHGEHVICELDVNDPSDCTLETAIRLARALALASSRERSSDVDVVTVHRHLDAARNHLKAVTSMKTKLTSIGGATREISAALDTMRQGVIECVAGVEEEIARGDHSAGHQDVA